MFQRCPSNFRAHLCRHAWGYALCQGVYFRSPKYRSPSGWQRNPPTHLFVHLKERKYRCVTSAVRLIGLTLCLQFIRLTDNCQIKLRETFTLTCPLDLAVMSNEPAPADRMHLTRDGHLETYRKLHCMAGLFHHIPSALSPPGLASHQTLVASFHSVPSPKANK